jgi:hypothetical protein
LSVFILLAVAAVVVVALVTVKAARTDTRDEVDRFRNARRLTTSWSSGAQTGTARPSQAAPEGALDRAEQRPPG